MLSLHEQIQRGCQLLYKKLSPCLTKHHGMKTYWGGEI